MPEKHAIALDVGGTSLNSALINEKGLLLEGSLQKTPINSKGSAEEIMGTFVDALGSAFKMAQAKDLEVLGIGMGMPGPFDYEQGISLIRGLDKYEAIYGLNLKHEFRKRLNLKENFPILLENDTWVFLRGEAWQGAGKDCFRLVGLTLGTGLGSAFMINGQIVVEGPGMRKRNDGGRWEGDYPSWLGGLPYDNGILEEKVSRRGMLLRYKELAKRETPGVDVREIAEMAKKGDRASLRLFIEAGSILGRTILPNVLEFKADCLVLGGRISKSFSLFEKSLKKELKSLPGLKITQAKNIDTAALYGAAKLVFLFRS